MEPRAEEGRPRQEVPVLASGKAKKGSSHAISIFYRNNSSGPCAATVGEEAFKSGHYVVTYLYPIKGNKKGKYKFKSKPIFGGTAAKGTLCGYLSNKAGDTEKKTVRAIEFT